MLQPKKTKFRRMQKGRMKGIAQRGNQLAYGSFGIKALESTWITGRQIEAARQAITRYMKREGQIWIRIFPINPSPRNPPRFVWVKVKVIPRDSWHPLRPDVFSSRRRAYPWRLHRSTSSRRSEIAYYDQFIVRREAQLTKLKVQHAVSPVEDPSIIKKSRRDIARMLTILRQKNPKC